MKLKNNNPIFFAIALGTNFVQKTPGILLQDRGLSFTVDEVFGLFICVNFWKLLKIVPQLKYCSLKLNNKPRQDW